MIIGQLATCEECRDGACKACKAFKRRAKARAARRARAEAMRSLGLTPVRGSVSGKLYWE